MGISKTQRKRSGFLIPNRSRLAEFEAKLFFCKKGGLVGLGAFEATRQKCAAELN